MLAMKAFRIEAGLSIKDIAARLDVSYVTVSRWECGMRQPSLEHLKELSVIYSKSVDELIQDVPYMDGRRFRKSCKGRRRRRKDAQL